MCRLRPPSARMKGGAAENFSEQETRPRFPEGSAALFSVLCGHTWERACSTSSRMSLTSSMPTERRTRSGDTPAARSSSSVICRWVLVAGWSTQVLASATWVAMEARRRPAMNREAPSRPPFTPKDTTPQVPWGRYFRARS